MPMFDPIAGCVGRAYALLQLGLRVLTGLQNPESRSPGYLQSDRSEDQIALAPGWDGIARFSSKVSYSRPRVPPPWNATARPYQDAPRRHREKDGMKQRRP